MTGGRIALGAALAAGLAACTTLGGGGWELDGEPVGDDRIVMGPGPEHCDWTSATFLWVAWPPGTRGDSFDDGRRYLRDPDGVIAPESTEGLDLDAELPEDAEPTGFRNGDGLELWFAASDDGATAYLVEQDGSAEAWPRAAAGIACA